MPRCRICDTEYTYETKVLDDDLCGKCEEAVLDVISEWEMEDAETESTDD